MGKITYEVPATPRSKVFTYYTDSLAVMGGRYIPPVPPAVDPATSEISINELDANNIVTKISINQDDPQVIDVEKRNMTVNKTGIGNVVGDLTITAPATINAVLKNAVTKISGSTYINVSPTTGIGDVAISVINVVTRCTGSVYIDVSVNTVNVVISANGLVPEAPFDCRDYFRFNGSWKAVDI